jgi:hypothetical protein
MALGIGLAVNNGRAALEGLFGKDVEFVRTPKSGAVDGKSPSGSGRYLARWPWHNAIELMFGVYCSVTLIVAIVTQSWASVPFVMLFAAGFLYVGCSSLFEVFRDRRAHGADEAQAPSTHSSPSPQSMLS